MGRQKAFNSLVDHCTVSDIFNFYSLLILEIEPEASQMLGPKSTTEINPSLVLNLNKDTDKMKM